MFLSSPVSVCPIRQTEKHTPWLLRASSLLTYTLGWLTHTCRLSAIKSTFWQSDTCGPAHSNHFLAVCVGVNIKVVLLHSTHFVLSFISSFTCLYDKEQMWIEQAGPLPWVTSSDKEERAPEREPGPTLHPSFEPWNPQLQSPEPLQSAAVIFLNAVLNWLLSRGICPHCWFGMKDMLGQAKDVDICLIFDTVLSAHECFINSRDGIWWCKGLQGCWKCQSRTSWNLIWVHFAKTAIRLREDQGGRKTCTDSDARMHARASAHSKAVQTATAFPAKCHCAVFVRT